MTHGRRGTSILWFRNLKTRDRRMLKFFAFVSEEKQFGRFVFGSLGRMVKLPPDSAERGILRFRSNRSAQDVRLLCAQRCKASRGYPNKSHFPLIPNATRQLLTQHYSTPHLPIRCEWQRRLWWTSFLVYTVVLSLPDRYIWCSGPLR